MLKTLKINSKKISVRLKVYMSKIMRTLIKVAVRTYATYSYCRTRCTQEKRSSKQGELQTSKNIAPSL